MSSFAAEEKLAANPSAPAQSMPAQAIPAQAIPTQSVPVQSTPISSPVPGTAPNRGGSQLIDRWGREHRSLRVSVTDVCNIRCVYCMPEEGAQFAPHENLLSFDKIEQFVRLVVPLGISNIRLTGGEPLLRPNLSDLVGRLFSIPGLNDLALTTNGMLLRDRLPDLVQAGLRRVNISLDTLSEATFQRISRRPGLGKVLAGIERALQFPELTIKLNALVLRDINLDGLFELVDFASSRSIDLRFIEFMPLDAERAWSGERVVSGQELRDKIAARYGALQPVTSADPSRPARDYVIAGRPGKLGFIDSVSKPFCGNCDRLRLTADGKVRNCLFSTEEWDVASLLGPSADAIRIRNQLSECLRAKHRSHGIADADFRPPSRAMYQIGG